MLVSVNIVSLLLSKFFNKECFGYYNYYYKVIYKPMSHFIIGKIIKQKNLTYQFLLRISSIMDCQISF
jgi:hypothetical protein